MMSSSLEVASLRGFLPVKLSFYLVVFAPVHGSLLVRLSNCEAFLCFRLSSERFSSCDVLFL